MAGPSRESAQLQSGPHERIAQQHALDLLAVVQGLRVQLVATGTFGSGHDGSVPERQGGTAGEACNGAASTGTATPLGDMWVSIWDGNSHVQYPRSSLNGAPQTGTQSTDLTEPYAVVFDSSGNLWPGRVHTT